MHDDTRFSLTPDGNAVAISQDDRFAPADAEPTAAIGCPLCGGNAEYIGTLGTMATYRCRSCARVYQRRRAA